MSGFLLKKIAPDIFNNNIQGRIHACVLARGHSVVRHDARCLLCSTHEVSNSYMVIKAKSESGSNLVIQALQQITLKIFIRSQSDFLTSLHSSAIPESPKV
jgi:hypothetical protein